MVIIGVTGRVKMTLRFVYGCSRSLDTSKFISFLGMIKLCFVLEKFYTFKFLFWWTFCKMFSGLILKVYTSKESYLENWRGGTFYNLTPLLSSKKYTQDLPSSLWEKLSIYEPWSVRNKTRMKKEDNLPRSRLSAVVTCLLKGEITQYSQFSVGNIYT